MRDGRESEGTEQGAVASGTARALLPLRCACASTRSRSSRTPSPNPDPNPDPIPDPNSNPSQVRVRLHSLVQLEKLTAALEQLPQVRP